MEIEEIRKRANGIDGKMADANKAEIHRRDCVTLLSLIDRYKEQEDKLIAYKANFEAERQIRVETLKDRGGWLTVQQSNDILEKE